MLVVKQEGCNFSFELIYLVHLDIRGQMTGQYLRFYDPANSSVLVVRRTCYLAGLSILQVGAVEASLNRKLPS